MIIFMTNKQVLKNFKKAGFSSVNEDVVELLNKVAFKFVKNLIEKSHSKHKDAQVLDASHLPQSGGRVLMPAEYFGVRTNRYVADAPMGTDMAVTADKIRPSFTAELNGGSDLTFTVSLQTIKNICAEVLSSKNLKLSQSAYKHIHSVFTTKMTEVLKSAKRAVKGDTVTKKDINAVLGMKKFKSLCV
jgi:histone H3/H4